MKGDRFEEGQLVYCIDNTGHEKELTTGIGYKVEWVGGDVDEEWTGVKNNQGNIKGYYAYKFSDDKSEEKPDISEPTKRPLEEEDLIKCFMKSVLDKDTEELMVGRLYYLHHFSPLDSRRIKVRRLGGSVIEAFFPIEWFNEATPEDFKDYEENYTKQPASDPINHPSHYNQGGIEAIDALEACVTGMTGWKATLTYQVIKYMWRWPWKNGIEDLKKARFYLERLIKKVEEEKP